MSENFFARINFHALSEESCHRVIVTFELYTETGSLTLRGA